MMIKQRFIASVILALTCVSASIDNNVNKTDTSQTSANLTKIDGKEGQIPIDGSDKVKPGNISTEKVAPNRASIKNANKPVKSINLPTNPNGNNKQAPSKGPKKVQPKNTEVQKEKVNPPLKSTTPSTFKNNNINIKENKGTKTTRTRALKNKYEDDEDEDEYEYEDEDEDDDKVESEEDSDDSGYSDDDGSGDDSDSIEQQVNIKKKEKEELLNRQKQLFNSKSSSEMQKALVQGNVINPLPQSLNPSSTPSSKTPEIKITLNNAPSTTTTTTTSSLLQSSTVGLVGIENTQNMCYLNSLIQVLYHLVGIRDRIMITETSSVLHTALASFFVRMNLASENAKRDQLQSTSVSLDVEFYAIARNALKEAKITIERTNDVSEFWTLLINDNNIPFILKDYVQLEITTQQVLNDVVISEASEVHGNVNVSVNDNPGVKINNLLEGTTDGTEIIPRKDLLSKKITSGQSKNVWTLLTEKVDKLQEGKSYKTGKTVTKITKASPILFIQASNFKIPDPLKPNEYRRDYDTPVLYDDEFELKDSHRTWKYKLFAIIVSQPNHFVTRICTDIKSDEWTLFNDQITSSISRNTPFESHESPYLFFYVDQDLLDTWKDNNKFQSAYNFEAMGRFMETLNRNHERMRDILGWVLEEKYAAPISLEFETN